ncbi:gamma-glutamyltransferase [Silvibacterium sp.]|uniref:gamma-glutamyltransferase n=1 Tax=Silvibacterium sp. TaxID=1964179 RepID=UPI0039E5C34D
MRGVAQWIVSSLMVGLVTNTSMAQTADSAKPVAAKHAMVVTIHHDASDVGLQILKEGGNAVDAAVAVGFALAVVFPQAGNIGGGGFMLIRMHDGKAHFIDYREKAPAAATADMYLDAQKNIVPGASTVGYKAIGVPGTVAGLAYAEKTYGRLTLAQVIAPAIRLAREGFILAPEEAHSMSVARNLPKFPESRKLFQRNGNLYQAGERFVQPELAETLTRISKDPSTFYTGSMATELAAEIQKGGGLITTADLAAYQVKERTPLYGKYRGYDILTSPPPSSGGIVLLESLNILSGFDLSKMGDRTPEQVHYLVEAYRRAYMDRGDYLGDPDFTTNPLHQMADPAYAAAWRKTIDPHAPSPSASLVRPAGYLPPVPQAASGHESDQTTHFSVVDAEGNAVSNTYTLNGLFGSGVTAGSLGFLLNNEMDDFASKVGVPNMFGLIQGPSNSIAPNKRPLSSMTPTIVLKHGKVLLVLGSPGGSTIITTVANDLISILDNHLDVQQAADAPRFHHQYLPDRIEVEKAFSLDTVSALRSSGYQVNRSNEADEKNPGVWGDSEMIYIDPMTHILFGADDQRHKFGKAAGY